MSFGLYVDLSYYKGRQGSYTSKAPRSTCCFAVPSGDFSGYFAFSMSSSSPRRYSRFFSIFLPRLSSFIVNSLRRPDYCSKLQYTIQCCSTQYNAAVQTEYNGIRRTEQRLEWTVNNIITAPYISNCWEFACCSHLQRFSTTELLCYHCCCCSRLFWRIFN